MSRAENVPAEADTLCEGCGYVLNGLPAGARCPECGKPSTESAAGLRQLPAWEVGAAASRPSAFIRATIDCIFRPTMFFRSMAVRPPGRASLRFARIHWIAAAALFGTAGWFHANIMGGVGPLLLIPPTMERTAYRLSLPILFIATYLMLFALNSIAARLTTFEATYRGIRLPLPVVLRALHYHAAHYLPVGLLAVATVGAYQLLLQWRPRHAPQFVMPYLYVLCGEVIVSAAYLFWTYWVAMRNLMYANRPEAVEGEPSGVNKRQIHGKEKKG